MKIKRLSLKCFDTAGTAPVITRAMETNAQINAILSFSFCLVYAQNARFVATSGQYSLKYPNTAR